MKWENVDMEHHRITYVPQKTARKTAYRSVTLPIHPNLLDALRKAQAWRSGNLPGEDYIIPNVAHRYLRNPSGIQKDVMKMIIFTVCTVSGIRLCRSARMRGSRWMWLLRLSATAARQ